MGDDCPTATPMASVYNRHELYIQHGGHRSYPNYTHGELVQVTFYCYRKKTCSDVLEQNMARVGCVRYMLLLIARILCIIIILLHHDAGFALPAHVFFFVRVTVGFREGSRCRSFV